MKKITIEELYSKIKNICQPLGFDSLTVLAHACYETANLEKVIGLNNYWGMKTPQHSKWTGLIEEVLTTEYIRKRENENEILAKSRAANIFAKRIASIEDCGKNWKVKVALSFRDWGTPEESVVWYCNFIKNNYKEAYIKRAIAFEYFPALVNYEAKYATDPRYAAAAIERYQWLKKTFFNTKQSAN